MMRYKEGRCGRVMAENDSIQSWGGEAILRIFLVDFRPGPSWRTGGTVFDQDLDDHVNDTWRTRPSARVLEDMKGLALPGRRIVD
jgi:hypothetical protein